MQPEDPTPITTGGDDSPWLDVAGAARRAHCAPRTLYRAIREGKLRASRLMARREYRIHREWVDAWIESAEIVNPNAPAGAARGLALSRLGRPRS